MVYLIGMGLEGPARSPIMERRCMGKGPEGQMD